jgi:hypothetical protein
MLGLASVGVVGACAFGAVFALADTTPTVVQPPVAISDSTGNDVLSVQIQGGIESTGQFDFSVANVGDWIGVIPVTNASPESSTLNGTVSTQFVASNSDTPTTTSVTISGTLDPVNLTSSMNVFVTLPGATSQTHYQLKGNAPNTGTAPAVAKTALNDVEALNWAAVYQIASNSITSQETQAQFVAAMTSQSEPAVTNAQFTGSGTTTIQGGVTFFSVPVTFSSGGTTYTSSIVLVWESGSWHFVGTGTPQPSS